ncbi:hypothetical protein CI109_102777 [Kwoniella shandongensis]|uniref:Uncharacterized protein n=1 Tax=Kwoniella shandongensis TaxID=1734106 RepID=A0A5M6C0G0_9TREE|nr:uncharacterized protein CI109_004902 [Kwoniella shandongensis]KAA5526699.1 hypothetical protein CI109_004902 [Kwoniella shandongensis]
MTQVLGQALVGIACLALLHAAFSTYEHLSILKALSRPTTTLPTSIIVEALVSLLLFIPGIALASGPLKDVTYRGELAKRSIDDADARMGFIRLSKRGKALFGDLDRSK